MAVIGAGKDTYFFINGLRTPHLFQLRKGIFLLPARCSIDIKELIPTTHTPMEFGMMALLCGGVYSQLKITAQGPKALAIKAWNSQWDILLLNAIFCAEATSLLQSKVTIKKLSKETSLNVMSWYIHLPRSSYFIKKKDIAWLSKYYPKAYSLLDNDSFRTAVHSLSSYYWHSVPSVQLSVLWAGIESLFNIQSEISFRLSASIAKFLEPTNSSKGLSLYQKTKKLYGFRSKAVHGVQSEIPETILPDTVKLLNLLIKKCITNGKLPPKTEKLLFYK